MSYGRTVKSLMIGALMASAVSVPAMAQDGEGGPQIEEIIITAEKREGSLQDTAIAISAFDSDLRDDLGIGGASDIANFTPGMSYNASPNRIFIRGVGRVDNSLGSEPGVAIYRDGIYTNEAASVSDNTFFVDRIEVLRGPQGTLYGRNAIGGAAAVYSKRPTDEFQGELRLIAGSYGQQQIGLAVSGPVTDRFRYRLAGEKQVNDGWIENIAPGHKGEDHGRLDFQRIAASFEFDVTERISWWVRWSAYEWDDSTYGGGSLDPYATTHNCGHIEDYSSDFQSLVPSATCGYLGPDPELGEVNKDWKGTITTPGNLATSHITYSGDNWDIKYIFGFNEYAWDYLNDYDGTSRTDLQYYEDISQHEEYMQHELQFISHFGEDVEVIFGLFYYKDDLWQPYTLYAPNNPVLATPIVTDFATFVIDGPANPEKIFYDQEGFLESESYAGYAQVDYYLSEEWHFTLGARYSKDEKEGFETQRIVWDSQQYYWWMIFPGFGPPAANWLNLNTQIGGVPAPGTLAASHFAVDFGNGYNSALHTDSWDAFTWSIGADWQPNDDTLVYGKISTGYKAGGFRLGSLQANQGVDAENLLAYEAGAKLTLGGVVQLNAATYLYDYEDMQVPVAAIINGVNNTFFQNLEKANQFGLEIDGQWLVSENLTLYATYTYMDTEIERMGGSGAIDSADVCSIDPVANAALIANANPFLAQLDLPNRTGAAGGCHPDQWLGSQLTGNELLLAPTNKVTANAIYTWFFDHGEFSLAGSYVYQSEMFSDIFNEIDKQIPAWQNVDLRATYRRPDSGLRISAFLRNALDEDITESISRSGWKFGNTRDASIRPGRWAGVEVNVEF